MRYLRGKRRKRKDAYIKIFGEIEYICDANMVEKLERMDAYTDSVETQDAEALWSTFKSLVCDVGNDHSSAVRTFQALSIYNIERMFNNESQSTFLTGLSCNTKHTGHWI